MTQAPLDVSSAEFDGGRRITYRAAFGGGVKHQVELGIPLRDLHFGLLHQPSGLHQPISFFSVVHRAGEIGQVERPDFLEALLAADRQRLVALLLSLVTQ